MAKKKEEGKSEPLPPLTGERSPQDVPPPAKLDDQLVIDHGSNQLSIDEINAALELDDLGEFELEYLNAEAERHLKNSRPEEAIMVPDPPPRLEQVEQEYIELNVPELVPLYRNGGVVLANEDPSSVPIIRIPVSPDNPFVDFEQHMQNVTRAGLAEELPLPVGVRDALFQVGSIKESDSLAEVYGMASETAAWLEDDLRNTEFGALPSTRFSKIIMESRLEGTLDATNFSPGGDGSFFDMTIPAYMMLRDKLQEVHRQRINFAFGPTAGEAIDNSNVAEIIIQDESLEWFLTRKVVEEGALRLSTRKKHWIDMTHGKEKGDKLLGEFGFRRDPSGRIWSPQDRLNTPDVIIDLQLHRSPYTSKLSDVLPEIRGVGDALELSSNTVLGIPKFIIGEWMLNKHPDLYYKGKNLGRAYFDALNGDLESAGRRIDSSTLAPEGDVRMQSEFNEKFFEEFQRLHDNPDLMQRHKDEADELFGAQFAGRRDTNKAVQTWAAMNMAYQKAYFHATEQEGMRIMEGHGRAAGTMKHMQELADETVELARSVPLDGDFSAWALRKTYNGLGHAFKELGALVGGVSNVTFGILEGAAIVGDRASMTGDKTLVEFHTRRNQEQTGLLNGMALWQQHMDLYNAVLTMEDFETRQEMFTEMDRLTTEHDWIDGGPSNFGELASGLLRAYKNDLPPVMQEFLLGMTRGGVSFDLHGAYERQNLARLNDDNHYAKMLNVGDMWRALRSGEFAIEDLSPEEAEKMAAINNLTLLNARGRAADSAFMAEIFLDPFVALGGIQLAGAGMRVGARLGKITTKQFGSFARNIQGTLADRLATVNKGAANSLSGKLTGDATIQATVIKVKQAASRSKPMMDLSLSREIEVTAAEADLTHDIISKLGGPARAAEGRRDGAQLSKGAIDSSKARVVISDTWQHVSRVIKNARFRDVTPGPVIDRLVAVATMSNPEIALWAKSMRANGASAMDIVRRVKSAMLDNHGVGVNVLHEDALVATRSAQAAAPGVDRVVAQAAKKSSQAAERGLIKSLQSSIFSAAAERLHAISTLGRRHARRIFEKKVRRRAEINAAKDGWEPQHFDAPHYVTEGDVRARLSQLRGSFRDAKELESASRAFAKSLRDLMDTKARQAVVLVGGKDPAGMTGAQLQALETSLDALTRHNLTRIRTLTPKVAPNDVASLRAQIDRAKGLMDRITGKVKTKGPGDNPGIFTPEEVQFVGARDWAQRRLLYHQGARAELYAARGKDGSTFLRGELNKSSDIKRLTGDRDATVEALRQMNHRIERSLPEIRKAAEEGRTPSLYTAADVEALDPTRAVGELAGVANQPGHMQRMMARIRDQFMDEIAAQKNLEARTRALMSQVDEHTARVMVQLSSDGATRISRTFPDLATDMAKEKTLSGQAQVARAFVENNFENILRVSFEDPLPEAGRLNELLFAPVRATTKAMKKSMEFVFGKDWERVPIIYQRIFMGRVARGEMHAYRQQLKAVKEMNRMTQEEMALAATVEGVTDAQKQVVLGRVFAGRLARPGDRGASRVVDAVDEAKLLRNERHMADLYRKEHELGFVADANMYHLNTYSVEAPNFLGKADDLMATDRVGRTSMSNIAEGNYKHRTAKGRGDKWVVTGQVRKETITEKGMPGRAFSTEKQADAFMAQQKVDPLDPTSNIRKEAPFKILSEIKRKEDIQRAIAEQANKADGMWRQIWDAMRRKEKKEPLQPRSAEATEWKVRIEDETTGEMVWRFFADRGDAKAVIRDSKAEGLKVGVEESSKFERGVVEAPEITMAAARVRSATNVAKGEMYSRLLKHPDFAQIGRKGMEPVFRDGAKGTPFAEAHSTKAMNGLERKLLDEAGAGAGDRMYVHPYLKGFIKEAEADVAANLPAMLKWTRGWMQMTKRFWTTQNPRAIRRNFTTNAFYTDLSGAAPWTAEGFEFWRQAFEVLKNPDFRKLLIEQDVIDASYAGNLVDILRSNWVLGQGEAAWQASLKAMNVWSRNSAVTEASGLAYKSIDDVARVVTALKKLSEGHPLQGLGKVVDEFHPNFGNHSAFGKSIVYNLEQYNPLGGIFTMFPYENGRVMLNALKRRPAKLMKWMAMQHSLSASTAIFYGVPVSYIQQGLEGQDPALNNWESFQDMMSGAMLPIPFVDERTGEVQFMHLDLTNDTPLGAMFGRSFNAFNISEMTRGYRSGDDVGSTISQIGVHFLNQFFVGKPGLDNIVSGITNQDMQTGRPITDPDLPGVDRATDYVAAGLMQTVLPAWAGQMLPDIGRIGEIKEAFSRKRLRVEQSLAGMPSPYTGLVPDLMQANLDLHLGVKTQFENSERKLGRLVKIMRYYFPSGGGSPEAPERTEARRLFFEDHRSAIDPRTKDPAEKKQRAELAKETDEFLRLRGYDKGERAVFVENLDRNGLERHLLGVEESWKLYLYKRMGEEMDLSPDWQGKIAGLYERKILGFFEQATRNSIKFGKRYLQSIKRFSETTETVEDAISLADKEFQGEHKSQWQQIFFYEKQIDAAVDEWKETNDLGAIFKRTMEIRRKRALDSKAARRAQKKPL